MLLLGQSSLIARILLDHSSRKRISISLLLKAEDPVHVGLEIFLLCNKFRIVLTGAKLHLLELFFEVFQLFFDLFESLAAVFVFHLNGQPPVLYRSTLRRLNSPAVVRSWEKIFFKILSLSIMVN